MGGGVGVLGAQNEPKVVHWVVERVVGAKPFPTNSCGPVGPTMGVFCEIWDQMGETLAFRDARGRISWYMVRHSDMGVGEVNDG